MQKTQEIASFSTTKNNDLNKKLLNNQTYNTIKKHVLASPQGVREFTGADRGNTAKPQLVSPQLHMQDTLTKKLEKIQDDKTTTPLNENGKACNIPEAINPQQI